jgi:hypothetical protein
MKVLLNILLVLTALGSLAQGSYSPAVGEVGCDAIHKDSSTIISWANHCTINRGYLNILNKALGVTSVGDATKPIGIADNLVVSLGDSGIATLGFNGSLFNGPGPDFVVFENGFDNYFLELAFVEVSSDGQHFFRFPSHSLTDTSNQVKSFDSLDATNLNNLAGKYRAFYGVPFDLEEMKNIVGLDINNITHIKVVDVIGTMNSSFASKDSSGQKINDPFPTAFPSGGFDLDAIGAIHIKPTSIFEHNLVEFAIYPNPSNGIINFSKKSKSAIVRVFDLNGRLVLEKKVDGTQLDLSSLNPSLYQLSFQSEYYTHSTKVIIQ